jgi:hypothetical protein
VNGQPDPVPVLAAGGRRSGRSLATRRATEQSAAAGEHTHFLACDGAWCVTRQPVGFLWTLVRRSGEPMAEEARC